MFKLVGSIAVAVGDKTVDELEMLAIEAGAEDMTSEEEIFVVYTKVEDLKTVKEQLEKAGLKIEGAELVDVALQKTELEESSRVEYEKLLEKLDEHEDVQEVFDNL